jgi:hypothetical protein
MPKSFNGFGTRYYGERDYRKDGSYLTTNFLCLLFFPVFPIHTVRVIPDPKNSVVGTNYYMVLEKRAPNLLQTASVYLCELTVLALIVLYFVRIEPVLKSYFPWLASGWLAPIPFFLALTPIFIAVRILRSKARKRVLAQDMSSPAAIEPR